MACGLPVIASDLPSQRDLLGRDCGLLCAAGDVDAFAAASRRLAAAPSAARAMGEAGRRRAVGRYDESVIIPRYLSLYRALTGRGPR